MPEVLMDVHLSLAELHCTAAVRNLPAAMYHQEQATKMLTPDPDHLLRKKAKRVEQLIKSSQAGTFMVTPEAIMRLGLKQVERRLQTWAIERAWGAAKRQKGETARKLQVSRPGLDKMWERLFAGNPSVSGHENVC